MIQEEEIQKSEINKIKEYHKENLEMSKMAIERGILTS